MTKKHVIQRRPFVVPTADGKMISEHFGAASEDVSSITADLSIAHMHVHEGWKEPAQVPDFDEFTLMVSGRMRVTIDEETIDLSAGESIFVPRGVRVRYQNPFGRPAEYWAICLPAFTAERAHREE